MNVRDALRQFIEAVDADAVRMDSNSIGEIGDAEGNYRPHQWHEEWLHHARAALAADEKDGWRPIETAPRNDMDTVIQLWCPYEGIFNGAARLIGFARRPGWRVMAYPYQGADDSGGNAITNETATHWRPLPEPPKE